MKDSLARIERVMRVNSTRFNLDVAVQDETLKQIRAGQSLLARFGNRSDEAQSWAPYLRERWWPLGVVDRGVLRVEVPASRRYEPGQLVQLLGPVGQPYRFRRKLESVLLIACDADPVPLLVMTPNLLKNNVNVSLLLTGDARAYETRHLAPEIEVLRAPDVVEWGEYVKVLGHADQIFVTVRQDDEVLHFAAILEMCRERLKNLDENRLFGIFQTMLLCGVGACDACAVRTRQGVRPICVDGPAFDLMTVRLAGAN
jgi:NAD(P)H-flavin reductase